MSSRLALISQPSSLAFPDTPKAMKDSHPHPLLSCLQGQRKPQSTWYPAAFYSLYVFLCACVCIFVYVCLLMCMYMDIHTCKGVLQCVYKCVKLRSLFLGSVLK